MKLKFKLSGTMMIRRDAFLYLDPKAPKNQFAQCGTCMMMTGLTCTIHGPSVAITKGHSCGYYVHGMPMPEEQGHEMKLVTPKESGLIKAQVRCENCQSFEKDQNTCTLFMRLNETGGFDLDSSVNQQGCCNAWVEKSS